MLLLSFAFIILILMIIVFKNYDNNDADNSKSLKTSHENSSTQNKNINFLHIREQPEYIVKFTRKSNINNPWKVLVFQEKGKCLEHIWNRWNTNNVKFVCENYRDELDSNTIAIIFNKYTPKELPGLLPHYKVFGITLEPQQFNGFNEHNIKFIQKHMMYYISGEINGLPPENFKRYYNFLPHIDIMNISYDEKPYIMSIMVSDQVTAPGHKYRHKLVENIQKKKLPVHVYGRGAYKYSGDNIKGEFSERELYDKYKYSIAIENYVEGDYISEKFTNCLSANTIPLYLGSHNIKTYFGSNCYYNLNGDIDHDIDIITKICNNPNEYKLDLHGAINELRVGGKAHIGTYIEKICIPNIIEYENKMF